MWKKGEEYKIGQFYWDGIWADLKKLYLPGVKNRDPRYGSLPNGPEGNKEKRAVLSVLKSLSSRISELSLRKRLGENADAFISEVTYIHLIRIKIMSLAALAIFFILWIWDIVLFFDGKWSESIGHSVVFYVHSFLLIFLVGVQIFCQKKIPPKYDQVKMYHKIFNGTSMATVLLCTSFLAYGDVLTKGSIVAYLGMVFAYASIFIMTNTFSLILYGTNMVVMVFLLILASSQLDRPMDVRIINAIAFTIVAFIMSRVLFLYYRKDYANRLVINRQTIEIGRQNEMKEKLIHELRHALAEVKTLRGFLPICSNCKKIRDDAGYWQQIEEYVQDHSEAEFSHSICPDCIRELYPDMADRILDKRDVID